MYKKDLNYEKHGDANKSVESTVNGKTTTKDKWRTSGTKISR